jgi:hypothetical protein
MLEATPEVIAAQPVAGAFVATGLMVGLPAPIPQGPNLERAATAAAPFPVGKQAANFPNPCGVGVSEEEV